MTDPEDDEPGEAQDPVAGPAAAGGEGASLAVPRPSLARLLWDHAGRLGAVLIALAVLAGLLFLAIIGYSAALALLIVLIIGLTLIIAGGRIRA